MAEEEKGNKREEPPKRILLSLSVSPRPRPFLSLPHLPSPSASSSCLSRTYVVGMRGPRVSKL